jgi:hypothetical protein
MVAYRRHAEHLRAVAQDQQDPAQYLEQGYQTVEFAHACYLSAQAGHWMSRRDPNAPPPPAPAPSTAT